MKFESKIALQGRDIWNRDVPETGAFAFACTIVVQWISGGGHAFERQAGFMPIAAGTRFMPSAW
jgi:hypothetical protein